MSTETKKEEATPPARDPKVDSMLKALGYLDDIDEQAKLPAEREGEETPALEPEATTPPEGGEKKPDEVVVPDPTAAKPEEKKVDTPPPEKKPDEVKPDEEERARKVAPSKKVSIEDVIASVKDSVTDAIKAATPEKVETKPDDTFRKGLHPAELKSLELAETAQRLMGDKYKDAVQKQEAWIRANREKVSQIVKENGKFDPNDEDYVSFVRANRPTIEQGDREEIFLLQATERASAHVKKDVAAQIASRDRQIAELRFAPVIERVADSVKSDVLAVAGEEFAKMFTETPEKLAEEFPLEAPIVASEVAQAVVLSKEYLSLAKGLVDFDEKNRSHTVIVDFITNQGKHIDAAKEPIIRDGKRLVSREKYFTLVEAGKDVSTITPLEDADVIKMLSFAAKERIKSQLTSERKRVDAISAAVTRKSSPPPAEKKVDAPAKKPDEAPPKGGTGPAKGAKTSPSSSKTVPAHMKAMGYDGLV